jgi:hypothetical protein
LSLTPELRLAYHQAMSIHSPTGSTLKHRLKSIIRVTRDEAMSDPTCEKDKYVYRQMRECLHRKIRLLLYRHRRRQETIEMKEKLFPSFQVKRCAGGFMVSIIDSKNNTQSDEGGRGDHAHDDSESESEEVNSGGDDDVAED